MPTRKVARKVVAKKSAAQPTRQHPAKNIEVKVEVTIMVAIGAGDPRSIEQVREDIRDDLKAGKTQAKLVTNMGGYYLVDGRVCLPDDYDPKTRGFKPGAHPPLWAMGPDERAVLARIEREKSSPAMSRQPQNLRTTQETDALHKQQERRPRTPAEALHDLHENSEWGKNKKRELAEREAAKKESASDDEDEFTEDEFEFDEEGDEEEPYFEDESGEDEEDDPEADEDEDEEFEAEWDEDDPMNDEVADEALEEQTSSVLAKLKSGGTNGKTSRKVTTVAKPVTRKKVVRRR